MTRNHVAAMLDEARRAAAIGAFPAAATACRAVLAIAPDCLDALYLLGVALCRSGESGRGLGLLQGMAVLYPDHAEIRSQLAAALALAGRHDEAILFYRALIAQSRGTEEIRIGLALSQRARGDLDGALATFREAIANAPASPGLCRHAGEAAYAGRRWASAEAFFRRGLVLDPGSAALNCDLGACLAEQDQHEAAAAVCRRALRCAPALARAWLNAGRAAIGRGWHRQAVRLDQRCIALNPGFADAYSNLCVALTFRGEGGRGAAVATRAVTLEPGVAKHRYNRSMALLKAGRFAEGWPEYEARRLIPRLGLRAPAPNDRSWNGEPLDGRTILLREEQGFGDTIQFIRFAERLKEMGASTIVSCRPSLHRLVAGCRGVDRVIAPDAEADLAFDHTAYLLSLPRWLVRSIADIPARTPYLSVAPELAAVWRSRVERAPGVRVGVVWAGNPNLGNTSRSSANRRRNIAPERLEPLFAVPGISWFSLQKDRADAPGHLPLIDLMDEVRDFADTAALVQSLDLIIGVDTAVLHLAGALGRPSWMLSRFDNCWRWLSGRDDSPWYPTLRLFRQEKPMDWEPVVARVAEDLSRLAARPVPGLPRRIA